MAGLLDGYATRPRGLLDHPDPITRMWHNLPDQGGGNVVPRPTVRSEAQHMLRELRGEVPAGVGINTVRGFTEGPATIRAFHGSPHRFERFDMSRIGTGEGAQAYGHGLYFAGAEDVARGYRDALAPGVRIGGQPMDFNNPVHIAAAALDRANGDVNKAIAPYMSRIVNGRTGAPGNELTLREIVRNIRENKNLPPVEVQGGHMYEVNLNTTPDRLLDWDASLTQQPAAVQRALQQEAPLIWDRVERAHNAQRQAFGQDVPLLPVAERGQSAWRALEQAPEGAAAAAERLRSAGIDGIQYLDAGSRAAGQGSRNYVMFDDRLIDIVRRYGFLPLLMGGGAGLLGGQGQGLLEQ